MPAVPTHYRNLRVSETASDQEIREAYRRLSKRYHPDFNPDNPEALRIMQLVNKAYAVLSDPEQRKRHDAWIAAQRRAKAASPLLQRAIAWRKRQNNKQFWLVLGIGLLLGLLVLQAWWWLASPGAAQKSPPSAVAQLVESGSGKAYQRPDKAPNGSAWPYFSDYIAGYPVAAQNGQSIASIANHGADRLVELQMQQGEAWQNVRTFYMPARGFFTLYELGAGQYRLFYIDLDSGKNTQTEAWPIQKQDDSPVYPDAGIVLPPTP
ncbi:J domain-containing protein [Eikenella sp. S3360]|uniref:J domain-containing protein n=1 Tax=Eikenella glucosivorans TaxID=2766967 RepID=A0ABS0N8T5_9NEIS|nr:J domain-containing protein [Eikenella glucosivorans]MBH5328733.1 J domain-containing protein [Eikenella glucosivorans]